MIPAPTPSTGRKGKPMKFRSVGRSSNWKVALVSGEQGIGQPPSGLVPEGRISWSAMFFRWRRPSPGFKAGPEGRGLECDVSSQIKSGRPSSDAERIRKGGHPGQQRRGHGKDRLAPGKIPAGLDFHLNINLKGTSSSARLSGPL